MNKKPENTNHSDLPLSQQVYIDLRNQLRQGEYQVGQRLIETEICEIFQVSRTPVREALRMLQTEGFLSTTSGGRIIVSEIDLQHAEEIYDMREIVEGLAAKLATKNAKTCDLIALEKIIQEQRKGVTTEKDFLDINDRFHGMIYSLSSNRYVIRSAETLANSAFMIRGTTYGQYNFEESSLRDHESIFEAIVSGDTIAAETAARDHIRRGRWQRIQLISNSEEDT